jgi:hypothetical protein
LVYGGTCALFLVLVATLYEVFYWMTKLLHPVRRLVLAKAGALEAVEARTWVERQLAMGQSKRAGLPAHMMPVVPPTQPDDTVEFRRV